ncbi:hypothetical protein A2U01_0074807, partial [Trifolium medium]|nr:hypothetical protein [Trifolium medium]
TKLTGSKTKSGGVNVSDTEKEGLDHSEGLRVGDIVVKLGAQQEREVRKEGQEKGDEQFLSEPDIPVDVVKAKDNKILLRNYRTMAEDVQWAHYGLV